VTAVSAHWYFDFISPFSYLQLCKVRQWCVHMPITPVPIAFGAVLKANGQLGPAEIPGKREFTYRFVQWQAEQMGVPLRFPPAHPFNPLTALRLCIASGTTWESIQTIFDHIWRDGGDGASATGLAPVALTLGIADVESATSAADVKNRLRVNTDSALAAGVFGVPTLRIEGELFWGNDATPMIEQWLANPKRFESAEYQRTANLPIGVERPR
jgi:2-hydroxychromene-2-carboxylate isomerase